MEHSTFETAHVTDQLKAAQLDMLRANLQTLTYPGYPDLQHRLIVDPNLLELSPVNERIVIPDGPWSVDIHPNRHDTETGPRLEKQFTLRRQGFTLDSRGRPLHPWHHEMMCDPSIGVATGKGFYWEWGPNKTADPIIMVGNEVLLIKRSDTGRWAFPGGMVDEGEVAIQAAMREACEEAGIDILDPTQAVLVYEGPVVDVRTTLHAWPETSAYLFRLDEKPDITTDPNEVEAYGWFPADVVLQDNTLFGSHRVLFMQALELQ